MLRSTTPAGSHGSLRGARVLSALPASLGLCALLYTSALHAQGAPPPPAAPPASTSQPPSTTQPPAGPPPAGPPPQGAAPQQPYGPYPQQPYGPYPQQPYGPYPQQPYGPYSPYAPPPYYGPPYYYEQPPPPLPPTKRANPTMMAVGVTMVVVGGVGFLSSLAMFATANNRIDVYCDGGLRCATRDDEGLQVAAGVLMGLSGAVLVGGIPLWVIGGKKVPVPQPEPKEKPEKYGRMELSAPTLSIGPTSASLSFAF